MTKNAALDRINITLRYAVFPALLKYISLGIFVLLLVAGFSATSSDEAFLMQLRNTNAGNLIVWSYWWPVIIVLAIFFGRIWCMVCPVEVITSMASRLGLKRKRPAWLLPGWAITVFYLFILIAGIQGLAIHRNPTYMAIYLLFIAGISVIVGLLWEKNTFCRYVCPVGYLLGIYSRLALIGWRVKNTQLCISCKDKSCIRKKYRYNLNEKSCGVDLIPGKITDNHDCILCAGCLKTCNRYKTETISGRPNPGFRYLGFSRDLFQLKPLRVPEMVFVLILSGFVFSEIWTEWAVSANLLRNLSREVAGWLQVSEPLFPNFIYALLIFLIFPWVWITIPFLVCRAGGSAIRLKDYLLNYGISLIPVIAAAHLVKAILKTTSRLPYFTHLPDDPSGMITAGKILTKEISLPAQPEWAVLTISVLSLMILLAGVWLAIRIIGKLNHNLQGSRNAGGCYLIPVLYGGGFLGLILAWRFSLFI